MMVVTILCTALYQMSTVPVLSMRFFSYICFEYCVVCVLFAICYFGNDVITESAKLTDCAYNCEWTNCSQEFKQNLIIFLSRSQTILQLFAGGIFSLSLENFLQVLLK
nr:unnamed protein product [Callosobruchus analis]